MARACPVPPGRNGRGRVVPGASHTKGFEETDASRAYPGTEPALWMFLHALTNPTPPDTSPSESIVSIQMAQERFVGENVQMQRERGVHAAPRSPLRHVRRGKVLFLSAFVGTAFWWLDSSSDSRDSTFVVAGTRILVIAKTCQVVGIAILMVGIAFGLPVGTPLCGVASLGIHGRPASWGDRTCPRHARAMPAPRPRHPKPKMHITRATPAP
eukprot:gene18380-biopygen2409